MGFGIHVLSGYCRQFADGQIRTAKDSLSARHSDEGTLEYTTYRNFTAAAAAARPLAQDDLARGRVLRTRV